MDFVEPWMIRSALVVGVLGAANAWLLLLSSKQSRQIPATDRSPRSDKRSPAGKAPCLNASRRALEGTVGRFG